jgi:hypothetical protein
MTAGLPPSLERLTLDGIADTEFVVFGKSSHFTILERRPAPAWR